MKSNANYKVNIKLVFHKLLSSLQAQHYLQEKE